MFSRLRSPLGASRSSRRLKLRENDPPNPNRRERDTSFSMIRSTVWPMFPVSGSSLRKVASRNSMPAVACHSPRVMRCSAVTSRFCPPLSSRWRKLRRPSMRYLFHL